MNRIIVIGGGPSGMMAASRAAELGAKILLLEKTPRVGNKLRITGKGRCNITNIGAIERFIENYGVNGRFLYNCYHRFFNEQLIDFLKSNGVEVVVERGGRVFPKSGDAHEITDVLQRIMNQNRVTVLYNKRVIKLIVRDDAIRAVKCDNGKVYTADAVILATGGMSYPDTGSSGDGYQLVREIGHQIVKPSPALVPLEIEDDFISSLQGLALENVELTAFQLPGKKPFASLFGDMMFTDLGISGPIVLTMSKTIIEHLKNDTGRVELSINFKPALTAQILDNRLLRELSANGKMKVKNMMHHLLPVRFIDVFLKRIALSGEKQCGEITKSERTSIVSALQDFRLTVSGHRPIAEAIITAGGIALDEINPKTMESKIVKGLYFCGEVIDIDGNTGGYNLQAAFSTGYLAGESAAQGDAGMRGS